MTSEGDAGVTQVTLGQSFRYGQNSTSAEDVGRKSAHPSPARPALTRRHAQDALASAAQHVGDAFAEEVREGALLEG